jgi:tRNA dimethylallyltransferase
MAQKYNGEIINADSRQVYRYMNIGTAKPSAADMASIPHHLFDMIAPDEDFSLAQYQSLAVERIRYIQEHNRIPFLVGGSGQYLWGILEGWQIPRIPPDPELRKQLENLAAEKGIDALYEQLQAADPEAAQKIDKRNVRRVIRALEVYRQTPVPLSRRQLKQPPDFSSLIIGLTAGRAYLYQRVDARVDQMIRQGLVSEVEELHRMGYGPGLPSLNSIGYKQIGRALRHEISLDEAIRQIKVDNHRFVRHQYAWFRLQDKRINWFDVEDPIEPGLLHLLSTFINTQ